MEKNNNLKKFKALNFAFELGFLVVGPIILFGLLGKIFDNYFQTTPFGLLIGVLISIIVTSVLVYKKASNILNS